MEVRWQWDGNGTELGTQSAVGRSCIEPSCIVRGTTTMRLNGGLDGGLESGSPLHISRLQLHISGRAATRCQQPGLTYRQPAM
jgi:hypothetical protein